jgi:hypothetical protein
VADLVSDGMLRVTWVTSISNINAPTTTELNAGTRLDTYMTPDGLRTPAETADVPNAKLSSTYDTAQAGRRKFTLGVTYIRQMPRVLEALLVYQASGYLVVRREVTSGTAFASTQKVEVYPAQCKQPSPAYGPNTMQMIDVDMTSTADAAFDATIA